jgi:hypothetical protein
LKNIEFYKVHQKDTRRIRAGKMLNKKKIYIDLKESKLQVFFAVLAFIEKNNDEYIYLCDESNKLILEECLKNCKFQMLDKGNSIHHYEVIKVEIDHSLPNTTLKGYFEAPLIFPKCINDIFFLPFEKKIDKIYFRGLFTYVRLIEMSKLLIQLSEYKAFFKMIFNVLMFRFEFVVSSGKVFMKFTKRGRVSNFKYIDVEYFKEMSRYKYVFCPSGDFIWTYRFYEAIQVGSLPLCLKNVKLYNEFNYLNFTSFSFINDSKTIKYNLLLFKKKFQLN